MPKLEVKSAKLKKERETSYGPMYDYYVIGELDGELDTLEMSFKKPENAPKVGETLQVTVEDTQWGRKAKKVQEPFHGGQKTGGGYERSEGESDRIMRQHAVTDTLSYLSVKAHSMDKAKIASLDPDAVIAIAEAKFFPYYKHGLARTGTQVLIDGDPGPAAEEELPFE